MFSDTEDRRSQNNRFESTNRNFNNFVIELVNRSENPKMSGFDSSEHDQSLIKFKGPRKYLNTQVFKNVPVNYVENVPLVVDGTVVYIVPEHPNSESKTWKGGQP